ncbi:MAG: hypothetical protein AAF846_14710 [Chloroflexota bacterium]
MGVLPCEIFVLATISGMTTMMAIFADVGMSLIVALNEMRALRYD